MKKLGKKLNTNKETLQAYICICNNCSSYCMGSIPDYAPQLAITGSNKI